MRYIAVLFLCTLTLTVWADGFTIPTYGVRAFYSITETDQLAIINLAPKAVTLDMFIAIDNIPVGQTITYVLPFWQKPEGFTMNALSGQYFRNQYLNDSKVGTIFAEEIRHANRTAAHILPDSYLRAGLCIYPPLMPVGLLSLFPVFGKHGYNFSPYASIALPAGSAELYHVSNDEDLQTLLAKAGLPARYASVLHRYHTSYYAIMRLHGPAKVLAKNAVSTQGLHFHFTHRTAGDNYSYTYPLGTGGAWAKPIGVTEVYATCADGYYLAAKAPTMGKMLASNERGSEYEYSQYAKDKLPVATASMLPQMRYPRAWHRVYYNSNPTEDITIRLVRRPIDPLFTLVSAWRDSEWMALPFILLGFLGSLLLSVHMTLRRACLANGQLDAFWKYGKRFVLLSFLSPLLMCLLILILMFIFQYYQYCNANETWQFPFRLLIFLLALIGSFVFGIIAWFIVYKQMDDNMSRGSMARSMLWSIPLLVCWYIFTALIYSTSNSLHFPFYIMLILIAAIGVIGPGIIGWVTRRKGGKLVHARILRATLLSLLLIFCSYILNNLMFTLFETDYFPFYSSPILFAIIGFIIGIFAWVKLQRRMDGELPPGTIARATWLSILYYFLLFPVWYGMAWLMDCIVKG